MSQYNAISHIDPKLRTWGSERQAEYVDAVNAHGSYTAAARVLGCTEFAVRSSLKRLQALAATRGYSPEHDMHHPVPDTHIAKGVSTLYDADGKVRMQWVKSAVDDAKWEAVKQAALEALAADIPRVAALPAPTMVAKHLCNVYTLTDCHVGMLAWPKETGEAWDLPIA